ncbi:MAG: methyltransferase [Nitrospinota bacterium]
MPSQEQPKQAAEAPPPTALLQMVTGYWVSQAISVAAKLGIADLLKNGSRRFEELAEATGTHGPSLYRLLRALASVGVFSEVGDGRFEPTPLAEYLRSDIPGSLRSLAIGWCEKWAWEPWGKLLYSVKTGQASFNHVFGMGLFEYLTRHSEAASLYNEALTGYTAQIAPAVVAAYDFSQFGTIVDVGGGEGILLAAILKAQPTLNGVHFDLPHVAESAGQYLKAAGLSARCKVVSGDFFEGVPKGDDAYILSNILHEFDDTLSTTILKNIHRVMSKKGKVLIVEPVIPIGNAPHPGKWRDLHMLVRLGGLERTESQFRTLLGQAGFELATVISTDSPTCLIEGVRT